MNLRQRKPNSPYIKSIRPMVRDDLQTLREKSSRPVIRRIREAHHIIARLDVTGLTLREIADQTGYSLNRLSTIRSAPAYKELVARYRGDETQAWRKERDEYYEYVKRVGLKSIRKLEEKLDADDENEVSEIPYRELLRIADSTSDRIGYHRKSTKENINIDFAARLEAAFSRSRTVKVIEHE